MQIKQVIIAHKSRDRLSQRWAQQYAKQFEQRGCQVLMGPSGAKDNPYPVFLASSSSPIDLAVVLGGGWNSFSGGATFSGSRYPHFSGECGGAFRIFNRVL